MIVVSYGLEISPIDIYINIIVPAPDAVTLILIHPHISTLRN